MLVLMLVMVLLVLVLVLQARLVVWVAQAASHQMPSSLSSGPWPRTRRLQVRDT
jgi:hypothetical protein